MYINNDDDNSIILTYNDWNLFRKSILSATILYLEKQIIKNTYQSLFIDEVDIIIKKYYNTINNDTINFEKFNLIFDKILLNILCFIDLYGFYLFISKEDNFSCYTRGNSLDIKIFLNIINYKPDEKNLIIFNNLLILLNKSITEYSIINIK